MYKSGNKLVFSASDLANHINCPHVTTQSLLEIDGKIKKPNQSNAMTEVLQQRGEAFEQTYLQELRDTGKTIVEISKNAGSPFQDTISAMQAGVDVIYQARLELDNWKGWADFLMRTDTPSSLGDWSYEVYDTKLATHTKAATILQLSLYTEIVASIQGVAPELMHVQTPEGKSSYRLTDYSAYYRLVKKRFLKAVEDKSRTYPDPVTHCDVCIWWEHCNKVRRADDHLRFVAGLGNLHMKEMRSWSIQSLQQLAVEPTPLRFKPTRGATQTYEKLIKQAKLQLQSRIEQRPVYELLPRVPDTGLYLLPEPNADDVYLDLEGDPMVLPAGREYIIGWYHRSEYYILWAEDAASEKAAFETFMDTVMGLWAQSPTMHIYHFGAYETSAFKRLMCRYGTRIEEMDRLLRAKKFVDLHTIVKQSLQAGVEKYSLKDLEKYHGYLREADLRTVAPIKAGYEFLLQTDRIAEATPAMRDVIKTYNQDDCISTQYLYNWLNQIRADLRASGEDIPAPEEQSGDPSEKLTKHQEWVKPIFDGLMDGVPAEKSERTTEQQIRYLLANLLDWYGREEKKLWWDKFRIEESTEDELLDEPAALTYLSYTGERDFIRNSVIDTYSYTQQETDLRKEDSVVFKSFRCEGTIVDIDRVLRKIYLKKSKRNADIHPLTIYRHKQINQDSKIVRVVELGSSVLTGGTDQPALKAALDLLKKSRPDIVEPVEKPTDALPGWIEWALKLNNSVLPIQGPPGTGKSYNASQMILALVAAGKRVGITALSHKVITSLMHTIYDESLKRGMQIDMMQKIDQNEGAALGAKWACINDYVQVKKKIYSFSIIGGTSHFWSHGEVEKTVDYLFVDEAGQLSLVDTLVCCFATNNLILLGDPQQLKQPQQGVHPEDTDVSALEHLLNGKPTIEPEQGIFLGITRRMHPEICEFDSELFYESRLTALPSLEAQTITGNTRFSGSGMIYHPVMHAGNTNFSAEEVIAIQNLVNDLTKGDVFWTNANGETRVLTAKDIKIIAPYNMQVFELRDVLGTIEVGTVDKFQGQEAPVIIYSMATSSPEDAPKGMDFLYSPNRFNVAVSRARGLFILVGSPALFEPACNSPEQIKLANPFCRFIEKARIISP